MDTVWCAAVKDHTSGDIRTFDPSNIADLCSYLDQYDVLISHGGIWFDFPVLRKVFGWEFKGTKVDTLLMSRTQRPGRTAPVGSGGGPHSVESWGMRLKNRKLEYEEWHHFTPAMMERCVQDVEIQHDIYRALLKEGMGEGWKEAHKLNHRMQHYLQLQSDYGWKVDRALLERSIRKLHQWMDRIDRAVIPHLPTVVEVHEAKKEGEYGFVKKPFLKTGRLAKRVEDWAASSGSPPADIAGPFARICFRVIDLDKNSEVKDFLLDQGWVPAEWNTNNAGERTSPKLSKDDPFEGIQGSLGQLIAKRVQCKQRLGVMDGWLHSIRPDGRIPTGVAGIAATGRLRHSGVVNVPSPERNSFFAKPMRSIFIPSEGKVMVGVDSKGNQIRQLVARMAEAGYPDEEFAQAVMHGNSKDGTDHHSVNMKRAKLPTRGHAKNFFYGFIFGASDWKVGKIIGGTKQDGAKLRKTYLDEMPGLRLTIEHLTEQWRETAQRYFDKDLGRWVYRNGKITGLDGRPITVASEHAVLNYALQSDEAIQMGHAYVRVHEECEKRGWKLHEDWAMLIWMHDEFQMECWPHLAKELGQIACDAIKWAGEYLKIKCPHDGEAKTGMSWCECH